MTRDEAEPKSPRGRVHMRIAGDELRFWAAGSTAAPESAPVAASLAVVRAVLRAGPTRATIERAIDHVEDLLMPLLRRLPATPRLAVDGDELLAVLRLVAADDRAVTSVEAVERLFNELADHAGGSPVAWRHAALPAQIALGLVVLREAMHHGGFREVSAGSASP